MLVDLTEEQVAFLLMACACACDEGLAPPTRDLLQLLDPAHCNDSLWNAVAKDEEFQRAALKMYG